MAITVNNRVIGFESRPHSQRAMLVVGKSRSAMGGFTIFVTPRKWSDGWGNKTPRSLDRGFRHNPTFSKPLAQTGIG